LQVFTLIRWSPYLVGILIGVLSWLSFLISDKPLGTSTSFVRTGGMVEKKILGDKVLEKDYYREYKPIIDWQWMLVLGVVIGSFISAQLSGQFQFQYIPDYWLLEFGNTPILRLLSTIIGGFFLGFGARWAGGCTSGHGISGTMQLSISSWIAVICFFIGGIITAFLIY
jgi:uncharacterized membrane protein YedE/YeeE